MNNIKYVLIKVPVKYDDQDIPYDFPHRLGNILILKVEASTGKIIGFPNDYSYDVYMKVTDQGIYSLLDEEDNLLIEKDGYVPDSHSIPGRYGDYIDFKIKNGIITNWFKHPTFEEFFL